MVRNTFRRQFSRVLCLSMSSLAASTGLVLAQDQQTNQSQVTKQSELEEIVVSAQRREESISRVPISIVAFSQADLEARAITEVDDLFRYTPGVTVDKSGEGDSSTISIRGITADTNAPTTAIYIDDTPIQVRKSGFSSLENSYPLLVDLARVEVLRGPQGTLFGSSAEGGAIRFITKEPDLTSPSFYARGEFGYNIDGGPTNGYAMSGNIPMVADTAALLLQAADERVGGYIDRYASNGYQTEANANWRHDTSVRGALKFAATDSLTVTPSVYYQRSEKGDADSYWPNISDPDSNQFSNANPAAYAYQRSFVLPALKIQWDIGAATLYSNTSYFSTRETRSSDYTSYIPALATGFTVTHVGYTDYFTPTTPTTSPPTEPNALPDQFIAGGYDNRMKVFVQEARVQSKGDGPLTWVGGVFFSRISENAFLAIGNRPADAWNQIVAVMPPPLYAYYGGIPLAEGLYSYDEDDKTLEKQTAGFGEVSWRAWQGLKLTVGARYQHYDYDYLQTAGGPFNGGPSSGGGNERENSFTPKYSVSYQIDPDNMVYATAAKGYRDGGANTPLFEVCNQDLKALNLTGGPYRADSVWSYEIGAKDQLLDRRLSLSSSAYIIDWSNIQTQIVLPICQLQLIANLGTARSQGGDIQAVALLTDHLTVSGSVSYIDARYTQSRLSEPNAEGFTPYLAKSGDYLGNSLFPIRPLSLVAGAEYLFNVFQLPAHIRFDYQYEGRAPLTTDLDPQSVVYNPRYIRLGGYGELDMEAGLAWKRFDLSFYAHNVLNSHPVIATVISGLVYDQADTYNTLTPVTIGIQGVYRFSGSH